MTAAPRLPVTDEIELKLVAPAHWLLGRADEAFFSICDKTVSRTRYSAHLHYYDTANLLLRNNGVVLRTLDANAPHYNSRIQIKTAGSDDGGALVRSEFNLAAKANGLRLQDVKNADAKALLAPAKRRKLEHWFTTVTERTELRAFFTIGGKQVMIECALDNVTYHRGDDRMIFRTGCEIELEVKPKYSDPTLTREEATAALRHVAALLTKQVPHLAPTSQSRADIGFGDLSGKRGDSGASAAKKI